MARKNIIAQGMGFFPQSVKWMLTGGLSSRDTVVSPGPGNILGGTSHLGIPVGKNSDLELLSAVGESQLTLLSTGEHSDLN